MSDEQPKKVRVTLAFDLVDGIGVDLPSLMMHMDGKAVGFIDSMDFSFKNKQRWGRFQYVQFRNPRETGEASDCGIWDIHTHGDHEEIND